MQLATLAISPIELLLFFATEQVVLYVTQTGFSSGNEDWRMYILPQWLQTDY